MLTEHRIQDIAAGGRFGLCVDDLGRLFSFGSNGNGELGLGDYLNRDRLTVVTGLANR